VAETLYELEVTGSRFRHVVSIKQSCPVQCIYLKCSEISEVKEDHAVRLKILFSTTGKSDSSTTQYLLDGQVKVTFFARRSLRIHLHI
jgi:hypothetical protein